MSGSSDSLDAITDPDVPPPTTRKQNMSFIGNIGPGSEVCKHMDKKIFDVFEKKNLMWPNETLLRNVCSEFFFVQI